MKIFSFVIAEDIERIAECGIRSDEYCALSAKIGGVERQCIIGYISPYDCELLGNTQYEPLKINVAPERVFVAEGIFRKEGLNDLYAKSFMKLSEYTFGFFRKPECLIPETVLPTCIERFNLTMDEPLLYKSSEEYYVESHFAKAADEIPGFREMAVRTLCENSAQNILHTEKYDVFTENGEVKFIAEKKDR